MKQREVEHAARKIQRFFKLVKTEVDREIKAEKKRRRAKRKKKKHKEPDVEDDMLENVWRKTITQNSVSPEEIRLAEAAAAKELVRNRKASSRRERSSSYAMPGIVRPEDTKSEVSALTIASSHFRTPRSRLTTLSHRALDEDLHLEEAFIDAEIAGAKERRRRTKSRKSSSNRRLQIEV